MGGLSKRRRGGVWLVTFVVALGTGITAVSAAPPTGFTETTVLQGLTNPTNLEFAPNGKIFVAEKGGKIKVFDSLSDTTPDVFADLSANVHDFWDRGLLGLAIHPQFPAQPYVYVLYAYDPPGGGTWLDGCPGNPGATGDGCVVSGRLSRLTANGNFMTGGELVLITDWCQQYPSHSVGDLAFGPDGALYATAGDGASFTFSDYGQGGGSMSPVVTPKNPCGDPPVAVGGNPTPPTAEGGALRSQDLRTAADPVSLDGTIIRIDPITGAALPDNPLFGSADTNAKRVVSYGLRNPFRITIDPDTGDLYAGDVGWNLWEEVNVVDADTSQVPNFGWPCYEGGNGTSLRQSGYDNLNLAVCESLYSAGSGAVTPPLFAYHHDSDITGSDSCPPANPPQGTSSSIAGLAIYPGGQYPGSYNGALFGADYSRNCIWVMYRDGDGNLDPSSIEVFQNQATGVVDLEIGPEGDLFYVRLGEGVIRRARFTGTNNPPTAAIVSTPSSGAAPLTVSLDGSGSSDPDGDAISEYVWDLDNDGEFDDRSGPVVSWTFEDPGLHTARLRVTDARGESDESSTVIQASNTSPTAQVLSPSSTLQWHVGEQVTFTGQGTDPEEGVLPAAASTWTVIMHHCELDTTCHEHVIETIPGNSGSFIAPDHDYPSWIELRLEVVDVHGATDSASIELQPETVDLTFRTSPPGLLLGFFGELGPDPLTKTWIVGATVEFDAPDSQDSGGYVWFWQSWSNGGPLVQSLAAPSSDTTYTAYYDRAPVLDTLGPWEVLEGTTPVADLNSTDNQDTEGAGLTYAISGGSDALHFDIDSSTGVFAFKSAPDFESPSDLDGDNVYLLTMSVTDSSGLSDSESLVVAVVEVSQQPSAVDDTFGTVEDLAVVLDVLGNDSGGGSDLDPAGTVIVSGAGHGTLVLQGDGTLLYTPTPNWFGLDSFTYRAEDVDGQQSNTATVEVSVESVNDHPIANAGPDQALTQVGLITLNGSGSGDLVEGDPLSYAWSFISRPRGSVASISNATSAVASFTADRVGTYVVRLTVSDGSDLAEDDMVVNIGRRAGPRPR